MEEKYVRWRKFECPLCQKYFWEKVRREMVAERLIKDERRIQQVKDELDWKFSACPFHHTLEGYFRRVRECWWKVRVEAKKPYKVVVEAWSRNGTLFYIVINPFAWWIGENGESEEGVYVGFGEDADVFYVLPLRDFLLYAPRKWGQALYDAVVLLPEQHEQEQHKQQEQTVES